jgi:hypothetical protein
LFRPRGWLAVGCFALMLCAWMSGCGAHGASAPQADAKDRLSKLFNLYRAYAEKNQKPPANEEALRGFGQKLTPTERADRLIGDDLEGIFTSPRDGQKFVVQYGMKPDPGRSRALAWEVTGQNGMRCVALTMGYVVEYDEQTLNESKR